MLSDDDGPGVVRPGRFGIEAPGGRRPAGLAGRRPVIPFGWCRPPQAVL